jgi:hypothetical protein
LTGQRDGRARRPTRTRQKDHPDDVPERPGAPGSGEYTLEQALELLAALEEAAEALRSTDHLTELPQVELEVRRLHGKLELGTNGGSDG